jgi:hypothetical protein
MLECPDATEKLALIVTQGGYLRISVHFAGCVAAILQPLGILIDPGTLQDKPLSHSHEDISIRYRPTPDLHLQT